MSPVLQLNKTALRIMLTTDFSKFLFVADVLPAYV